MLHTGKWLLHSCSCFDQCYIWLEWFCWLVFALLPFYFRLKHLNHKRYTPWCRSLEFLAVVVSCFQSGRAMRIDSVFCSAAVTHPGMLCGQKETVLADFKHPYVSFLFLIGFISQKKRQEKEEVRGCWKSRGMGANWPSVCFMMYWEALSQWHMQLLVSVESSVSYCRCPVIWNKEDLSWVLEGGNCYMESTWALERDLSTKVKRQTSWKITLAAAVQRKKETLSRKGYAEQYVARMIVWRDGTNRGDRTTGVRALGELVCRWRRKALQNK